jgi:(2R)-3-sulfolactate dehydrogenase (NADP+)
MQTTIGEAEAFLGEIFEAAGMPADPAHRTAWALVMAEAWGRSSHGLMRVGFYLPRLAQGGTDAKAELRLVHDRGAVASYDGSNGLGHWQCYAAANDAVRRATAHGIAAVGVANSGHNGALGLYTLPIIEAGFVGLIFSNGPAVMPPSGGHEALLSTSPIAAGIPTSPRPLIIDLATSAVARGRIAQAAAAGEAIPQGWAFDRDGEPTTDAAVGLAGLVAPMAGPKGFVLALLVESLTGGMVGPALAGDIGDSLTLANAPLPQRSAHLVIAIDPAALDIDGRAHERLDLLAERIEATGGRLPGARYPIGEDLVPDRVLVVADAVARDLARSAAGLGVAVPEAFALAEATPSQ